jgi:hypothetical protein
MPSDVFSHQLSGIPPGIPLTRGDQQSYLVRDPVHRGRFHINIVS